MSIRSSAAIAACKVVHGGMRLLGRTARAMPGAVALKIDPRIIDELSEGHKTIVTTGTNGKTTTTHIIQQAVINTYGTAAYDPSSTNLETGIATTLCLDSSVGGARTSDWAVIECDEGASKTILPAMHPQVMVVTNLYRDQVDRYTSWTTARDYIIKAAQSSPETVLVLDADCQVTASSTAARTSSFPAARSRTSATGAARSADASGLSPTSPARPSPTAARRAARSRSA